MKKQSIFWIGNLIVLVPIILFIVKCKKDDPPADPTKETPHLIRGILFNPHLTYDSIMDIEGNFYKTIQIGTQTWMAENLRTTKYNDNSIIPLFTKYSDWLTMHNPGFGWYNNDSSAFKDYGALYNYYSILTGKLCPVGWHVSTDSEWSILTDYLEGVLVVGAKLKETDTIHWGSPNAKATNESGFTALPGGYINDSGESWGNREKGDFWCLSEDVTISAYTRILRYKESTIQRNNTYLMMGLSIRCVKDK
jgi:uncharacterized protein (TIGR02145 family)